LQKFSKIIVIAADLLLIMLIAVSFNYAQEIILNKKQVNKYQFGFIENKGQIHDQNYLPNTDVKYLLTMNNGMNIQLKSNSFSYDTYVLERKAKTKERELSDRFIKTFDSIEHWDFTCHFHRVDVELINANPEPEILAEYPSEDFLNYYNAVTDEKGATFVRYYKKVTYKNIYPGIDLEFVTNTDADKAFKYNFIVKPGADASQIRLKYKGANKTFLLDEKLNINVEHGTFYENIPVSHLQESNEIIDVRYRVTGEDEYSFIISKYDRRKVLVIDPLPILDWATYMGGLGYDAAYDIATDSNCNIFMTGYTTSWTDIATAFSYHSSLNYEEDAFIEMFSPKGNLLWGTYFGGNKDEIGYSIFIDNRGFIYITGFTNSTNGIASASAYQTNLFSGTDVFIGKFNSSGQRVWSTYYGGESGDYAFDIAVGNHNDVIIVGRTVSTTNFATPGAFKTSTGSTGDAFILKFDTSGKRQWATYYGGTDYDYANSVIVDDNGNIYLTGETNSINLATAGTHQYYKDDSYDAYIAKFNTNGQRIWATYYGGNDFDKGESIVLDKNKNIYITGVTLSSNKIATSTAFQKIRGDSNDAFLAKFDSNGKIIWGTYYGGNCGDYGEDISLDRYNSIYITGWTKSPSSISTNSVFQQNNNGNIDAFIAKINNNGDLIWGSYFGGIKQDQAKGIAVDKNNNIVFCGYTKSPDSISTSNAYKKAFGGSIDIFVTKLFECPKYDSIKIKTCNSFMFNGNIINSSGLYYDTFKAINGCDSIIVLDIQFFPKQKSSFLTGYPEQCYNDQNFTIIDQSKIVGDSIIKWYWQIDTASVAKIDSLQGRFPVLDTIPIGVWNIQLVTVTSNLCYDTIVKTITVHPSPKADFTISDTAQCKNGNLYTFTDQSTISCGNLTYYWQFGDDSTRFTTQKIVSHHYEKEGDIVVLLAAVSDKYCMDIKAQMIHVYPAPVIAFKVINDTVQCLNGNYFAFENKTDISKGIIYYTWFWGDNTTCPDPLPTHTYAYDSMFTIELKAVSDKGCRDSAFLKVIVYPDPKTDFSWTTPCAEMEVKFTDKSTIKSGFTIDDYYWYFGEGTYTTNDKNPVYIYQNAGIYLVKHRAISNKGCINEKIKALIIPFKINQNELMRATVEDEKVRIDWQPPDTGYIQSYQIEKSTDGINFNRLIMLDASQHTFLDTKVDVNKNSYIYRMTATDSCKITSNYSNIGKTILLEADTSEQFTVLKWTPYEYWKSGIKYYELQVAGSQTNDKSALSFQNVSDVLPSVLKVTDSFNQLNSEYYFYRVIAYRESDNLPSVSNIVCTPTPFRLFVPNAFSPNGDGLNDYFLPSGVYIIDYHLQIYNKWGEKLFESDDINQGWDGKYNGRDCMPDNYVYSIYSKGTNGKGKLVTGTVMLMK